MSRKRLAHPLAKSRRCWSLFIQSEMPALARWLSCQRGEKPHTPHPHGCQGRRRALPWTHSLRVGIRRQPPRCWSWERLQQCGFTGNPEIFLGSWEGRCPPPGEGVPRPHQKLSRGAAAAQRRRMGEKFCLSRPAPGFLRFFISALVVLCYWSGACGSSHGILCPTVARQTLNL